MNWVKGSFKKIVEEGTRIKKVEKGIWRSAEMTPVK